MDIVEYHAPDRVLRQFGYVQNIPVATVWEHDHYARDERAGVDDAWRLHMQQQVQSWDVRMARLAVVGHDTPIHVYMEWYMRITRIIIGNPSRRRPDGLGYVALAGAYEALVSFISLKLKPSSYVLLYKFIQLLIFANICRYGPFRRCAMRALPVRRPPRRRSMQHG